MISLTGIETHNINLPIKELVGTLLFMEYPSTVVYADNENNPIIKEWVDCTEDGKIDRYFYFKCSKRFLKGFLNGNISHQDLISYAIDGLLYFQDIENSRVVKSVVLSSSHLPLSYKPEHDFYFNFNDGVDTEAVINYFNLESIPFVSQISPSIKDISYSKKSETLNLHLHQGQGVGFGSINTDILGNTLSKFDSFYKDIALDFFLSKNRGSSTLNQKQKSELNEYITTEVYGSLAASYSVLIRPKASRYNAFNDFSDTENIAKKIFELLKNSNQLELFKTEYILHSDYTIKSFKGFVKNLYENELSIDLNWFSPISKNEYVKDLDFRQASTILNNIEKLSIVSEDSFSKKGKFRAINCDTGHFIFVSNDEEQFIGYFEKLIRTGSERINFINLYEIKISRKTIKEPGRIDAKIEDTITAFFEIE